MSGNAGDGLNSAQRTAVTTLSGPLLVLAGAGTGKTRVITFRIAELIRDGIKPNRILAVTFTNKAAKEMKERALALLGKKKKNDASPEISTFHSLCVRMLRRHANRLGYPEAFTIYDRGDQESVARGALRDIRVGNQKLRPGDLVNMVSGWKSAGISPPEAEQIAKKETEQLAALAYGRYQAQLRASGAMDFDDLLLNTERLFSDHPEARFAESSRFDHLLIDEYQDTNGLQYRIVKALAQGHRNLCVVGDDDQSIYGWRGAEVEHILNFQNDWPEARVVRLEENYRCTQWVVHLANTLIQHNKARHDKVLIAARGRGAPPRFLKFEEEDAEAEAIAMEIHTKINREDQERVKASDIAILFRTNEQPRAFEQALRRSGIPYVLVGGQSFFDRKEIKDLLCYLRILANPNDEVSLLRVINTPARGIGTSSLQALLDHAVGSGEPLWKVLPAATTLPDVSQAAANAVANFRSLIDEFRARLGRDKLSALVGELIVRVDYKAELERLYKDPSEHEARWNTVEQFVSSVATYENKADSPSLLGFLEESSLSSRDDDDDPSQRKEHSITLMTLHSAKGLEFPEVYLVGMEEGLLPHKRSVIESPGQIDEERRLCYVGVTRAQNFLTLSCCKNRMKWGKLRPQIPSRFLLEMRGETAKALEIAQASYEQLSKEIDRAAARAEAEEEKLKPKPKKPKEPPAPKPSVESKPRPAKPMPVKQGPPLSQETVPAPHRPDPSGHPMELGRSSSPLPAPSEPHAISATLPSSPGTSETFRAPPSPRPPAFPSLTESDPAPPLASATTHGSATTRNPAPTNDPGNESATLAPPPRRDGPRIEAAPETRRSHEFIQTSLFRDRE